MCGMIRNLPMSGSFCDVRLSLRYAGTFHGWYVRHYRSSSNSPILSWHQVSSAIITQSQLYGADAADVWGDPRLLYADGGDQALVEMEKAGIRHIITHGEKAAAYMAYGRAPAG